MKTPSIEELKEEEPAPGQLPPVSTTNKLHWRNRACITFGEAAELLSCPVAQLRKLVRQGKLNPITSMGRKWRLTPADIDKLLNERLRNV